MFGFLKSLDELQWAFDKSKQLDHKARQNIHRIYPLIVLIKEDAALRIKRFLFYMLKYFCHFKMGVFGYWFTLELA